MAIIKGTKKNNVLLGTVAADTISGLQGNDTLRGNDGNDILNGGTGNDKLFGEDGKDTLNGGAGKDTLDGGEYNDQLFGGAGNDTLRGGYDNDFVDGGAGNDLIIAGYGADNFVGGAGIDTVSYAGVTGAVEVDLSTGNGDNAAFGDTYLGIENAIGTAFSDTIYGTGDVNTLTGGAGFDHLYGSSGDDILIGGADGDTLDGGLDTDTLIGGDGSDTLEGGSGADVLNGGDGTDTASYRSSFSAVTVDLLDPTINTGDAFGDTYQSIEAIEGSKLNDQLFGDDGDNRINGGDGDDVVYGRGGADTITNGQGADFIDGGDGDDILAYVVDTGSDILHGGAGTDWLLIAFSLVPVTINLTAGTGGGGAVGDTFHTIENVRGSDYGDSLIAAVGGTVHGGGGDDVISDSSGTEILYGGKGNDLLTDNVLGSEDGLQDIFWLGRAAGIDTIFGFTDGQDLLRVSQVDFNLSALSAAQVINSLTSTATIAQSQFIYETDTKTIWYDYDGTGGILPESIATLSGYAGTLDVANFQLTTESLTPFG
ncbi:MAG: calcium-binding protein [Hyphomicrobiaceae bacterium]